MSHWALVALVAFSWWSAEEGGLTLQYHMWSGYAILAIVAFRVLWGFIGTRHARFGDFVRGPRTVGVTLGRLLDRRPLGYLGHNPVGGWMVLALLAALLLQGVLGLFANDDLLNEGPLYDYVSRDTSDFLTGLHHSGFNVLLALVGLHVAAVAWHRLRKGENLVTAMLTGRKPRPATADHSCEGGRR